MYVHIFFFSSLDTLLVVGASKRLRRADANRGKASGGGTPRKRFL